MDAEVDQSNKPLLSIVVPTRNESGNVLPLWQRTSAALGGTPFEICFVDDSDDATPTVLAQLEESEPNRVRCKFRRDADREGGLSTAVIDGLRIAQGQYVCVMDADLQHPPEAIPEMLKAAQSGADLVVSSRYVKTGDSSGLNGFSRRLVSRVAGATARLLFSEARRSSDPLSGFFLCRRQLIEGIEFRPVGFKILLELLVCVPNIAVTDVPLQFAARASGESKASLKQGVLFARHLWSLFFHVQGSARFWKFGIVGASGLAIFLPLLAVFSGPVHLSPWIAFWPAYLPSLLWNTTLNRLWTFADQRNQLIGGEPSRYLQRAIVSVVLMYLTFLAMVAAHADTVVAGLVGAIVAVIVNGFVNRRAVRRRPLIFTQVSSDAAVQESLAHLATQIGAERAYLLPASGSVTPASIPPSLLAHVVQFRRPTIWTEAASHRAQRRTNIDLMSTLLIPVVNGGVVLAVAVCERNSPSGYSNRALEQATSAIEMIVPAVVAAAGTTEARQT